MPCGTCKIGERWVGVYTFIFPRQPSGNTIILGFSVHVIWFGGMFVMTPTYKRKRNGAVVPSSVDIVPTSTSRLGETLHDVTRANCHVKLRRLSIPHITKD